ncbi:MAG: Acg family FMN-binding oxidoreductase [Actinomycetes bacterium]
MRTATRTGLTADVVDYMIATACRAPSVHNTQPWRFRFHDGAIELRADPSRALRIADPQARELVISCGAALCNLELAVRRLGLEPRTRLLPDDGDPELLATVRGLPGGRPTRAEQRLLGAISNRHTHRAAFADRRPSTALLDELRVAARVDGAFLTVVPDGAGAERVLDLAWAADRTQRQDIAWRAEMVKWANKPDQHSRDGVPPDAYPTDPAAYGGGRLPTRDFSLRRGWGRGNKPGAGGAVLTVLTTEADGPRAWLRAGKALQHVLLLAAGKSVFANYATQPLELPDVRDALRAAIHTPGYPQMLFQLGHAGPSALTSRRPVSEVLQREAAISLDR